MSVKSLRKSNWSIKNCVKKVNTRFTDGQYFYFPITYGVCKKRKYCNRMIKKKFPPVDECSCFVCLRTQNK